MPQNSRQGIKEAGSPPSLTIRESTRERKEAEIDPDSYFCELCRAMLDGRLTISHQDPNPFRQFNSLKHEHYQDLDSWRIAADDGCYFCALFWRRNTTDTLTLFTFEEVFAGICVEFDYLQRDIELGDCNIAVLFEYKNGPPNPLGWPYQMEFFLEVLQDHIPAQRSRTLANAGVGVTCLQLASSRTPTEESWSCAKTWIERCTSSHIRCTGRHDQTWHPTRLLDIQKAADKVWLVETHKSSISGPYATLSHRWPPDFQKTLILRPNTYDIFCQGVLIADLPQAVQDSITCCKNLSIRYLWIDCMCIIQNPKDPVDWQKEASVMDKVYTHSRVHLSALAARNTDSSMFQPRNAQSFNGRVTTSIAKAFGCNTSPRRYRVINGDKWSQNVARSHINARAWILQERILSPRILHFGFGQLFWECCMGSATEDCPFIVTPLMTDHDRGLRNLEPDAQIEKSMQANPRDHDHGLYKMWARIVGKYSSCGLTKSSDKLIALSGLAKRVQSIVDDAYVAGMWQRHLPMQLFWEITNDAGNAPIDLLRHRRSIRPVQYRAPSFSWASIDAAVRFHPP